MLKRIEIVIGGHGGQGVVLAGQILGKAAAFEGKMLCRCKATASKPEGA